MKMRLRKNWREQQKNLRRKETPTKQYERNGMEWNVGFSLFFIGVISLFFCTHSFMPIHDIHAIYSLNGCSMSKRHYQIDFR